MSINNLILVKKRTFLSWRPRDLPRNDLWQKSDPWQIFLNTTSHERYSSRKVLHIVGTPNRIKGEHVKRPRTSIQTRGYEVLVVGGVRAGNRSVSSGRRRRERRSQANRRRGESEGGDPGLAHTFAHILQINNRNAIKVDISLHWGIFIRRIWSCTIGAPFLDVAQKNLILNVMNCHSADPGISGSESVSKIQVGPLV